MRTYITELCEGGHHSTAKSYQDALNSFKRLVVGRKSLIPILITRTFYFIKISEKLCVDRLEKRVASQPEGEKDYEVYVASQKEMSLTAAGKRKWVERILFRSIVFIRCTDTLRR